VAALAGGAPLGSAVDLGALDLEVLPGMLGWLFAEGLVTALRVPNDDSSLLGDVE
jgi:hypothetical protein